MTVLTLTSIKYLAEPSFLPWGKIITSYIINFGKLIVCSSQTLMGFGLCELQTLYYLAVILGGFFTLKNPH